MFRIVHVVVGLALSVVVVAGAAGDGVSEPLEPLITEVDRVAARALRRYHVPGAAVALVHGGQVAWAGGYGLADKEAGIAVSEATVFQVASISKAVTAFGVLHLVERGALELDRPVEDYLRRWHLPPSELDNSGVTVRRLLSHTAGLSRHGYPGVHPDRPLPSIEQTLTGDPSGPVDVRVIQEPGAAFRYSGGGYSLLSLVVEEVTGQEFDAFMQESVLRPLGMGRSGYAWTPELQALTAVGYDEQGRPWPNFLFGGKGCCGLYATAADLARFLAALMPGPDGEPPGRCVVSPDTVELMLSQVASLSGGASLGGDAVGLGMVLETLPSGAELVSHGGDNRGWHALAAAMPEVGEGIVVLTNGDIGGVHVWVELLRAWAAWTGQGQPKVCRVVGGILAGSAALAGMLVLALVAYGTWLVRGARAGRRTWSWRSARTPAWRRALRIAGVVAVVALWWFQVYGLLGILTPRTGGWLTAAVVLCAGAAVLGALFAPAREEDEDGDKKRFPALCAAVGGGKRDARRATRDEVGRGRRACNGRSGGIG